MAVSLVTVGVPLLRAVLWGRYSGRFDFWSLQTHWAGEAFDILNVGLLLWSASFLAGAAGILWLRRCHRLDGQKDRESEPEEGR